MKLPNPKKQVSYGVANASSWWRPAAVKTEWPKRSAEFTEFANERAAAKGSRQVTGGRVVRRVTTVEYSYDE